MVPQPTDRRTAAFLSLLFISGLLLGGTLMNLAEHYWFHAHPASEYDIRQHRLIAAKMSERLHLTPQQQQQVDAVLRQTVGQYLALEHRLAPQFDQVRQSDRDHLRAILDPKQRQDFDRLVQEVDAEYPINERPAILSPSPCDQAAASSGH